MLNTMKMYPELKFGYIGWSLISLLYVNWFSCYNALNIHITVPLYQLCTELVNVRYTFLICSDPRKIK